LAAGLNDAHYGRTTISIADRDVPDITLNARSPVSLSVEVGFDSPQAERTFRLQFVPLSRPGLKSSQPTLTGELGMVGVTALAPSKFTITLPAFTEYMIGGGSWPRGTTPETYFKEVRCGQGEFIEIKARSTTQLRLKGSIR
jgi:hypothetical protein